MKTLLARTFLTLVLVTQLSLLARADGLTFTYPLPPAPANVPKAVYPAPRLDWIERFQGNIDKLKDGPYDFIIDGDSITDGWQAKGKDVWAKHFGAIKSVDMGISGDQTEHVLWRLQHGQVAGLDPKLVMLMIGTNNHGQDPQSVADAIKLIIGEYETRCPHAQILLLAIFPRGAAADNPDRAWIAKVNGIISGYASDKRVTYLDIGKNFLQPDGTLTADIMPDFLHPNDKGYEIWAQAVLPVVQKYFAAAK
jgi:beta-glucosidase